MNTTTIKNITETRTTGPEVNEAHQNEIQHLLAAEEISAHDANAMAFCLTTCAPAMMDMNATAWEAFLGMIVKTREAYRTHGGCHLQQWFETEAERAANLATDMPAILLPRRITPEQLSGAEPLPI